MLKVFSPSTIAKWGAGGLGVVSPMAYVAGSAPHYEALWRLSIDLEEPILSCTKAVTGGGGISNKTFEIYLTLGQEKTDVLDRKIIFKIREISSEGEDSKGRRTLRDLDWRNWQLKSEDLQAVILQIPTKPSEGSHHLLEDVKPCKDSKIKLTKISRGGIVASTIRFEIDKNKCIRGTGYKKCDINLIATEGNLQWADNFNPKLKFSAF